MHLCRAIAYLVRYYTHMLQAPKTKLTLSFTLLLGVTTLVAFSKYWLSLLMSGDLGKVSQVMLIVFAVLTTLYALFRKGAAWQVAVVLVFGFLIGGFASLVL